MEALPEMNDRQVIFVGGTSYSGSTMLDMMLSHGPGGFSCGEVAAVYSPYRRRHLSYDDNSNNNSDVQWRSIIGDNPDELYESIFAADPQISRIIDSSKDPIWIRDRINSLQARGIVARNVLIWKSPAEFADSRYKRGRRFGWRRAWLNYHRSYFRLVQNWLSVSYHSLTTDSETLALLCKALSVPYFDGKEQYWLTSYQTLFGNSSAKIHLTDSKIEDHIQSKRQVIYYSAPDRQFDRFNLDKRFRPILKCLGEKEEQLKRPGSLTYHIPGTLMGSPTRIRLKMLRKALVASIYNYVGKMGRKF